MTYIVVDFEATCCDKGVGEFGEVIIEFANWLHKFQAPIFCSWGSYDKNQLIRDCVFHNVEYPFSNEHINIKQKFANNMGLNKGVGLGRALRLVNTEFTGTAHRGIDDARNMAKLSKYIFH